MHQLLLPDPCVPCKALGFGSKELSRNFQGLVVPRLVAPGLSLVAVAVQSQEICRTLSQG